MPRPLPDEIGLADHWDERKGLRRAAIKRGCLLDWGTDPKKNGVPSLETLSYNAVAIQIAMDLWCPTQSFPKTLPLDLVKAEVGGWKRFFVWGGAGRSRALKMLKTKLVQFAPKGLLVFHYTCPLLKKFIGFIGH